jgi:hypothetical protein
MIRHTKLFFADAQEVIERVGRDAILFRVGALQYQFGELGFAFPAEMAWTAGPASIMESVEALSVIARGGITQRLPIHACATRRLGSCLPARSQLHTCARLRAAFQRASILSSCGNNASEIFRPRPIFAPESSLRWRERITVDGSVESPASHKL